MAGIAVRTSRDFVRNRKASFLFWRLPALVMVMIAILDIGSEATGAVWALCLSVFGFGCLSNAMRCGRLHCYFTGPFFLVMAVVVAAPRVRLGVARATRLAMDRRGHPRWGGGAHRRARADLGSVLRRQ